MRLSAMLVGLLAGGIATQLSAQTWVRLPNGGLGYVTDYLTSGFFSCNHYVNGCRSSGNTATFTNNGVSMKITFTGLQQTLVAINKSTTYIKLGTISTKVSGPGFVFPTSATPNAYWLFFFLTLSGLPSSPWGTGWFEGWIVRNNQVVPISSYTGTSTVLPVAIPSPPPTNYGAVVLTKKSYPDLPMGDNSFDLFASVNLTPEPATLGLLATGLAGLAGAGLGKRRRRR